MSKTITVHAVLDAETFRKFSIFEGLFRKGNLTAPILFASILSISGIVCLLFGGVILGIILLIIGLGFPGLFVRNFFHSINTQVKYLNLENPKPIYTLSFSESPDGIVVTNHGQGNEPLQYEWKSLYNVYRVQGCIYLYVLPDKAYLLPDGQADDSTDALWQFICDMLPADKLHDRRKL